MLSASRFIPLCLPSSHSLFLKWRRLRIHVEATDLLLNNLCCYVEDCLDPARNVKILSTSLCDNFFFIILIYLLLHYDMSILQGHLEVTKSFSYFPLVKHVYLRTRMRTHACTCIHAHTFSYVFTKGSESRVFPHTVWDA